MIVSILILLALYDSSRWGIQNFYTEFWNSLNMLIYAHFSKFTNNGFSLFVDRFWFFFSFLFHLVELHEVYQTSTQNFEILIWKLFTLYIYAKFVKNNNKCFFSFICQSFSIPFALYDSTRWEMQKFYTEFWNSLSMLIYEHF